MEHHPVCQYNRCRNLTEKKKKIHNVYLKTNGKKLLNLTQVVKFKIFNKLLVRAELPQDILL